MIFIFSNMLSRVRDSGLPDISSHGYQQDHVVEKHGLDLGQFLVEHQYYNIH